MVGRLGFPVFRRFAFLDRLVVLARIVLLGRRHDRRIDDLPAPWRDSPCSSRTHQTDRTALPPRPPWPAPRERARVLASGTASSSSKPRKRMKEKRSRSWYSA